ncbi:MAG: aldose 1-epimerase family protein [Armatimonadota bacterium]
MPNLFGRSWTKDELMKHVGDLDQIGGARRVMLAEGNEAGSEAVLFRTGTGLTFTCLAGRALDISSAEYCGRSLCWRSQTGDTAAPYFEPDGLGWLRNFYGGLVMTCGMSNAGAPHADPTSSEGEPMWDPEQGKWLPTGSIGLHGRVSNIPAKNLYVDGAWEGDDYVFWAQGKMREGMVFGANLQLTRKVSAKLGQNKIWLHDEVTNEGWKPQEHMFLYHCNLGFPLVTDDSEYLINARETSPRDEAAAPYVDKWAEFPAPTPNQVEWVYYHDMATNDDGTTMVGFARKNSDDCCALGLYIKYNKNQLPFFGQWKMPAEGTYVTGLEPATCHVEGRVKDRNEGRLKVLQPGEVAKYDLEIGVLNTLDEVAEIEDAIKSMK